MFEGHVPSGVRVRIPPRPLIDKVNKIFYNCFMKKKELIAKRGHRCEKCKNEKWLEELISLEIHHINPPSEEEVDLQLLCPNCHSQTPNYRGRGIKKAQSRDVGEVSDDEIQEAVTKSKNIRQLLLKLKLVAKGGNYETIRRKLLALGLKKKFIRAEKIERICLNCKFAFVSIRDLKFCSVDCSNKHNGKIPKTTKIEWPNIEVVKNLVDSYGFSATGRKLGVSDNAIRKRIKRMAT
jgi:hypothetical protein